MESNHPRSHSHQAVPGCRIEVNRSLTNVQPWDESTAQTARKTMMSQNTIAAINDLEALGAVSKDFHLIHRGFTSRWTNNVVGNPDFAYSITPWMGNLAKTSSTIRLLAGSVLTLQAQKRSAQKAFRGWRRLTMIFPGSDTYSFPGRWRRDTASAANLPYQSLQDGQTPSLANEREFQFQATRVGHRKESLASGSEFAGPPGRGSLPNRPADSKHLGRSSCTST
jgi:hypothetical protein